MDDVGIFYDHLVYFTAIGNILWSFGIFFLVLVCCTKKNLATLVCLRKEKRKKEKKYFGCKKTKNI
jgi:hypothetical protein